MFYRNVYLSPHGEYWIGGCCSAKSVADAYAKAQRALNNNRCLYRLNIRPKPGVSLTS